MERAEGFGEGKSPVTDVHQTKLEMNRARCSESVWLGTRLGDCFAGKFVPLFPKVAKTTMNISEQEINKSRINIYAPKGM